MIVRWLAVCFGALVASWACQAQDSGVYAAGDVGYHWPDVVNTTVTGQGTRWTFTPKSNAAGFLRAGYAIDSDWRVELEGGYRPGSLGAIQAGFYPPIFAADYVPVGGIRFSNVSGHINATTAMANAIYDIPLGLPVRPFVGAGAGLVHLGVVAQGGFPFCAICALPICFVCTVNLKTDDTSDKVGWQAIGGLSFALAPQWTVDATYRYVRANGVGWNTLSGYGLFTPGSFKGNYSDSSVTMGIRYSFGD